MEIRLFSERSVWTMVHGIVLGGGALVALGAGLFSLRAMRTAGPSTVTAHDQSRYLAWVMGFAAAALWLTVLVGTYVNFPPYRATPPDGLIDLSRYPRSLILSNPDTVWFHSIPAMELVPGDLDPQAGRDRGGHGTAGCGSSVTIRCGARGSDSSAASQSIPALMSRSDR